MQIVFSARAVRQLSDLNIYISEAAGDSVADVYTSRIIRFCKGLDTFPHRGNRRDDVLPGLRIVGFERRVTIAFLISGENVVIEGIFYGGQDWSDALTRP